MTAFYGALLLSPTATGAPAFRIAVVGNRYRGNSVRQPEGVIVPGW